MVRLLTRRVVAPEVVKQDGVETAVYESPYCVGPCTCGRNCHFNTDLHDDETRFDPDAEVDDSWYEYAMATLGAK